jgi:hypothetical protein
MSAIRSDPQAEQLRRLRILVSALPGERHVQGSLLREVVEVVGSTPGLKAAREQATSLLESAQAGMSDSEFDRRARMLASLVDRASFRRSASNES